MKKEKLAYTAPTSDILEFRIESKILDESIVWGAPIEDGDLDDWGDIN